VLKSLSNNWKLKDHEEGCEVVFDVNFEFRNIYHSTAAQLFFQEVHSRMLKAFLERAQQKHKEGKD
jgi:coenzyme Q-binding protein COQ10